MINQNGGVMVDLTCAERKRTPVMALVFAVFGSKGLLTPKKLLGYAPTARAFQFGTPDLVKVGRGKQISLLFPVTPPNLIFTW